MVVVHLVTLDLVVVAAALEAIVTTCYVDVVSQHSLGGVPYIFENGQVNYRDNLTFWEIDLFAYLDSSLLTLCKQISILPKMMT